MAKSKEELKAVLMAQEVYMPDGKTLNTTKLNMISGVVISPFMEAMYQEKDYGQVETRGAFAHIGQPAFLYHQRWLLEGIAQMRQKHCIVH